MGRLLLVSEAIKIDCKPCGARSAQGCPCSAARPGAKQALRITGMSVLEVVFSRGWPGHLQGWGALSREAGKNMSRGRGNLPGAVKAPLCPSLDL